MAPSPTLVASRILGALVADIVPASVRRRVHPAIAEIRQRIVDMSDEEETSMATARGGSCREGGGPPPPVSDVDM